jgi:hypothetical protein
VWGGKREESERKVRGELVPSTSQPCMYVWTYCNENYANTKKIFLIKFKNKYFLYIPLVQEK